MKRIITTFLLFCSFVPATLYAQESGKSPFGIGGELVNRYVWRGLNLGGNTPSFQPTIGIDFGSGTHAFTIGAFGAYSFGGQQLQECDLFASYTWKEIIGITITDYFFPMDDGTGASYFNYKKGQTSHLYEGILQFNGTKKIPFYGLFAMNFYGADAVKADPDTTVFRIAYSKYLELGYVKTFSDMEWKVFAGLSLDNPDESLGEKGFYGNTGPALINLGCKFSKDIAITDKFSLPVQAQLIFNPDAKRVFMVFGITL